MRCSKGIVLGAVILVCVFSGCDNAAGPEKGSERPGGLYMASEIHDGADKFMDVQSRDPVDPSTFIRPDYYVDLPEGRVYFSSEENAKKFENNPQQYRENLSRKVQTKPVTREEWDRIQGK